MVSHLHEQPTEGTRGQPEGPFPLWLAICGLAFVIGLFSFLNSPYFHVTDVIVTGNSVLPSSDLMDLSGVFPGDNILHLDLRRVADRVATHPRVRHIHVERHLPDTLVLIVREHVPVALVPIAEIGDSPEAESAQGEGTENRLMAVNDAVEEVPLLGDEGERLPIIDAGEDKLIVQAVAAAAHMPPSLRERIATIGAEGEGDDVRIIAHTRTGGIIIFGDDGELLRKGAIAASLLDSDDYAVVDVRFPRSPAVRPR